MTKPEHAPAPPSGRVLEVLGAFLKLGLTSFGGPVAHLGYFREEFVARRGWLTDHAYADLVALCQFLPGPASSQVGFALGMMRAGWLGALAAFVAFTLPSAIVMAVFALTAASLDGPVADGVLHGLKVVAVAIVAQAVLGMARTLCPDPLRASIAVVAVISLAIMSGPFGMVAAIVIGAVAGLVLDKDKAVPPASEMSLPIRPAQGIAALIACTVLLLGLPFAADSGFGMFDAFYRSGALVFGGGHVVLPLLEAETVAPGALAADTFLAGYGAAQAVPGPLFTFAAYLGAAMGGWSGALVALIAIFLPGFLLLVGVLPFWDRFRALTAAQSMMRGANAAVVGILGAALYDPVFTSAIKGMADFSLALTCFVLLIVWKQSPLRVVIVAAFGGVITALI
ncbi:chromate efflux transporter [Sagittula sp. SSi028]|uniref:chromate efflux transporter n=1 Tax=Sagittula sp. SSi028 TaxID=3400636 RepID=UPI003AF82D3C